MISIERLTVASGEDLILDDINLQIPMNSITTLVGRSGSGKTTLLRSLNRLNECFSNLKISGRILMPLNGELVDIFTMRDLCELRRSVGMLFQSPNVLPASIEKNIRVPLRCVLEVPKKEVPDHVERVLKEVHLWDEVADRLDAPASTLSGGQQQRLCFARALALNPEILLLDEPTASLDSASASKIESLILELKSRYTIIAVSHCLDQVSRIADTIVVLKEGTVSYATKNDLKAK